MVTITGVTSDEPVDGLGGTCTGTVTVCVPKSKRASTCPDDGQWFDATLP